MNNLEKIKEMNPELYEKIKLKYITNAQGLKTQLDIFPTDYLEENFSKDTSLEEFNQKLKGYHLVFQAQEYARELVENAKEKANKQLKEAEEILSKLKKDA